MEDTSKFKEGRNGYREHIMNIAYQEEQDYNTPDTCLGLDLCSGKKRGRSYLLCFDETREFDNDNQEGKKSENYHLEGLL